MQFTSSGGIVKAKRYVSKSVCTGFFDGENLSTAIKDCFVTPVCLFEDPKQTISGSSTCFISPRLSDNLKLSIFVQVD